MSNFKAKMHQNRFQLELCPRPRCGSLQRSPDPLVVIKGPTFQKRGWVQGWEGERVGRQGWEEEGKGRDGKRV